MSQSQPNLTLAAKIAAISKDLGAIQKGGHNKEQHYDFIEYAAVSGKIRELLDKHGVAIIPSVENYARDDVKSKSGAAGYHYMLTMRFTVINASDANDKIEATWMGESTDWGDKGINKAETSGTKYFYMRLFNISEKSDSDNDPDRTSGTIGKSAPKEAKTYPKSTLNFQEIEDQAAIIDDLESLKDLYKSLKPETLSPAEQARINGIINKRKQELEK